MKKITLEERVGTMQWQQIRREQYTRTGFLLLNKAGFMRRVCKRLLDSE